MRVTFEPLVAGDYQLFALFDPALANSSRHDTATRERRRAARRRTATVASALVAAPGFTRTSNGFVGTSDGWTDLASDKALDFDYDTAPDGNVLQTGEIALRRHDDVHARARLRRLDRRRRVGGPREPRCTGSRRAPRPTRTSGTAISRRGRYARRRPTALTGGLLTQYNVALMTVKAHEDKTYPRRLHRLADAAVGLRRQRRRGRRRLPLRVGARPVPAGAVAARRGRSRRRRPRRDVAVHPPAAGRRDVPAELARRRHARPAQHPARRDGVPDRPRLAALAHRRRDLGRASARPPTRWWRAGRRRRRSAGRRPAATRTRRSPARSPASSPPPTSPASAATPTARALWLGVADEWQRSTGDVDVHDQRPARRRPLLRAHRRRRRPQRRLRARLRQRRRRAQGERGRRRRHPRARAPRRQGAQRSLRRRLAAGDRRVAGDRHAERARLAPLHVRRLRREGRRLAVGVQHAGHQGARVAAAQRRARRVRGRQRPRRPAVPADDGQHRQRRLHDPRAGLGRDPARAGAVRLPARQGHRVGLAAGVGDGAVRAPRPRDRRRQAGRDAGRGAATATPPARRRAVPELAITSPARRLARRRRAGHRDAAPPTPTKVTSATATDVTVTPSGGTFSATVDAPARPQPDHASSPRAPTAAPTCARSPSSRSAPASAGSPTRPATTTGPGTYTLPDQLGLRQGRLRPHRASTSSPTATTRCSWPGSPARSSTRWAATRSPTSGSTSTSAAGAGAAAPALPGHEPGHRGRRGTSPSWATAASNSAGIYAPGGTKTADGDMLAVPRDAADRGRRAALGARRARPAERALRRRDVRQRRGAARASASSGPSTTSTTGTTRRPAFSGSRSTASAAAPARSTSRSRARTPTPATPTRST